MVHSVINASAVLPAKVSEVMWFHVAWTAAKQKPSVQAKSWPCPLAHYQAGWV